MPRARRLGLIDDATWALFEARQEAIARAGEELRAVVVTPTPDTRARFAAAGIPLPTASTAETLLRRPEVDWTLLASVLHLPALSEDEAEQVEADVKYAGYVQRAERRADDARRMEAVAIPASVRWAEVGGLSTEVRERLERARPETLGAVSRLPGVTPAAVGIVAAWLARASAV
jgi:tRNA uridine 5-carboxymethylaminomethyl modification enzyme